MGKSLPDQSNDFPSVYLSITHAHGMQLSDFRCRDSSYKTQKAEKSAIHLVLAKKLQECARFFRNNDFIRLLLVSSNRLMITLTISFGLPCIQDMELNGVHKKVTLKVVLE